jgi:hypothetical protein
MRFYIVFNGLQPDDPEIDAFYKNDSGSTVHQKSPMGRMEDQDRKYAIVSQFQRFYGENSVN